METIVKKILCEQLKLLAEHSEKACVTELPDLSHSMVEIAKIILKIY